MADFAFKTPSDYHWENYRKFVHDTMDKNPTYGYRKIHALGKTAGTDLSQREVRDLMNDKRQNNG